MASYFLCWTAQAMLSQLAHLRAWLGHQMVNAVEVPLTGLFSGDITISTTGFEFKSSAFGHTELMAAH